MTKIYHGRPSTLLTTNNPEKLTSDCVTNMLLSSTSSFNECKDTM